MPKFINSRKGLTRYAFQCGYIEASYGGVYDPYGDIPRDIWNKNNRRLTLSFENNTYVVCYIDPMEPPTYWNESPQRIKAYFRSQNEARKLYFYLINHFKLIRKIFPSLKDYHDAISFQYCELSHTPQRIL